MSVYLVKGKGWRFDFTKYNIRHTGAWFKSKAEAKRAEAEQRKELEQNSQSLMKDGDQPTPTDTDFLELINRKLDHVKAYNSKRHYQEFIYMAKRWLRNWGKLACSEITADMVEGFVLKRAKVSAYTANKEIRYIRSTFNYGLKKGLISVDPSQGLEFLPVEKTVKYVPPQEDIDKVLSVADAGTGDYLMVIKDTMARVNEVNGLVWNDVDLERRTITLYTRKKRGGHRTPRMVPMTERLYQVMERRYRNRDKSKPWVFWHRYWNRKQGEWAEGPYKDRKGLMKGLCSRAGVRYFRYHALRHAGASALDSLGVPVATIQKLLGHENRTTTEIYLHSIGRNEREAIQLLGQVGAAPEQKSHTKSHTEKRNRLRLVT